MIKNKSQIPVYIDLIICLIIMPLIITLLPVEKWLVHSRTYLVSLIIYIYLLYFTFRYVRLAHLIMRRRIFTALCIFGILLLVTIALTHIKFITNDPDASPGQLLARQGLRRQTFWFFFLVVTGFSFTIELAFELFHQMLSKQELAAQKDKAELALYKSQINPHFLFNTLNTLYALVISGSEKTESAFVKFSDILRYMYSQSTEELIPVGEELEYINQYVDLQKLRLNKHTKIKMDIKADNRQTLIPPMILITFVENAFKYGTSSDTDCVISIMINLKDNCLKMDTDNLVMKRRNDGKQGLGISNCRKRLELLYPGQYELHTVETDGHYKTSLKINLK